MDGNLPALVGRLQQLEEARQRLAKQREELPASPFLIRLDWRALERQAREKLALWRSLATRHVAEGRTLLSALLEGPIVFTPFEEPAARGYRFRGYAVLTGLVEGVAEAVKLSSPKYGEKWRPHREPLGSGLWPDRGTIPVSGVIAHRRPSPTAEAESQASRTE